VDVGSDTPGTTVETDDEESDDEEPEEFDVHSVEPSDIVLHSAVGSESGDGADSDPESEQVIPPLPSIVHPS